MQNVKINIKEKDLRNKLIREFTHTKTEEIIMDSKAFTSWSNGVLTVIYHKDTDTFNTIEEDGRTEW